MTAERNPPGESSLLSRPLELLTAAALRAPAVVVAVAVALTLVAILITGNGLEFKTSRLDLLNAKSAYNQRWLAYLDEFGDRDDAVVVVQTADQALLRTVIDDLGEQLRARGKLFQSVFDRADLSPLRAKALHYLSEAQLQQLHAQTAQAHALIPRDSKHADPGLQLARLNDTLEKVRAASPEAHQQWQQHYGEIAGALQLTLRPPQPNANQQPDWNQLTEKFGNQYLLSEHGQVGFVLCKLKIDSSEMARGKQAITALRQIIDTTRRRHPQVWVGLTGMPIIEYDEMQSSQADMLWTGILSMAFVAIIFVAGYGGLRHALLACVVLQLGMAWSFGFVTLFIGHLNILSSAFGVVVIGQGIDFSIHYVASYLKLRRLGHRTAEALTMTARDVGPGVLMGAISTAAAFFAAGFTEFTGIAELGIIGGAGILLCVLATAVVLPPLIYLFDQNRESLPVPELLPVARWVRPLTRHPSLTVVSTLAITLLLTGGVAWMRYDHNLLNLQPANLESSAIERELFSRLDDSVWFAVSMCDTKEDLLARKAQFEKLPQVAKTEEIASLLPKSSHRQQQQIAEIHSRLLDLPQRPAPVSIDTRRLKREVARARQLLERDASYETPLQQQYAQISQAINFQSDEQLAAGLSMTTAALATHAIAPLRELREISDPSPPTLDDLPPQLTDRYLGEHGKYLIKVYAKGNIWDLDRLSHFVREVESVDPRVTGHPVQTFYASQHMQQSYIWSGCYALVAVFLLLLLDFRNLWHTLLAMTPLCLGFTQMCGLIGWLNIPFNPANMIGLPLIMGIGVDEGAHLVHEMRRQRGRFKLEDSTAIAVILTSVTTMAGFGTLILSRHQGLRSMGQLLTLGVGLCLACTVLFLPALLAVMTKDRPEKADEESNEIVDEDFDVRIDDEEPQEELVATQIPQYEPAAQYEPDVPELQSELSPDPAVLNLQSEIANLQSEPPSPAPPPLVSTISYYRIEVPPQPPLAPTSDETLSLEALHRELLAKRQVAAEPMTGPLPEMPPTFRLDEGTDEFSPLLFGPVTNIVPRRRALPRRAVESDTLPGEIGPVEREPDQVN
jgi:hopanoid biosynthesis associated RND transporter like protein HpnN